MQIVAIRGKEDGADFLMMNQIAVIWCILIMLYKKRCGTKFTKTMSTLATQSSYAIREMLRYVGVGINYNSSLVIFLDILGMV